MRPAAQGAPAHASQVPSQMNEPHSLSPLSDVPILIVEDDPASARMLTALLTAAGARHVRSARSAEDAMTILETTRVRVLLVDLLLPGMSGLQLVRRVMAEPSRHDTMAIAMSGMDVYDAERRALEAGCVGFVQKPLDFDRLLLILANSLNGCL